jgi:hypothetical protein
MYLQGSVDYVLNGQGHGPVGDLFGQCRFDPGLLRPFINNKGIPSVTLQTGKMTYNSATKVYEPDYKTYPIASLQAKGVQSPVFNATGLQMRSWIEIDRAVERATRQRLRAWTDLLAASRRGGFNAMSKMTLEYQSMTDPGEAVVDMDAMTDARTDRPLFNLRSIPLPITHSDFWFSAREIAVSRNSSTPLDTVMAEAAGRRVAELIERTLIGVETGVTYGTQTAGYGTHTGTSTVYGYTNFPYRVTKTDLHTPTSANPENVVEDVIEMRETMYSNGYFGPFMLYTSTGYDRFFDDDYFRTGGTSVTRTLRERVESIEGISGIRRLDYLTSGYQMVMVQMTPEVAQAIDGMGVTTVQWESQGGLRQNFKVLGIQVPLLRAPYNGIAGIIHATTS